MLKNTFTLFLLLFLVHSSYSQMPPPRHVNVKVYMDKKIISANDDDLVLTAYSSSSWNIKNKHRVIPDDIKGENGIEVIVDYDECVTLDMRINGKIMIIHSHGDIDSIQFTEGEYFLNYAENYLFSIRLGENQKWTNFDLSNFKNEKHSSPTFMMEDSKYNREEKVKGCYTYAKKIEEVHGGKDWAKNACVDTYQHPIISDTIEEADWITREVSKGGQKNRISIYPFLKTKFIKHEFYTEGKTYDHRISITEDNGETWKEIMFLKNEWYVHLVYFPSENKIGIDISNSGVVLINDYNFSGWKYYVRNLDDEENYYDKDYNLKEDKIGLVLENANWYDNYFGNFVLSE